MMGIMAHTTPLIGGRPKLWIKCARRLYAIFGVTRSKEQLRKRWSDLKLHEPEQFRRIKQILDKSR